MRMKRKNNIVKTKRLKTNTKEEKHIERTSIKEKEVYKKEKNKALNNTIRELLNTENLSRIGTQLEDKLHERFALIYSVTLDGVNSYLLAQQEVKVNGASGKKITYQGAGAMASRLLDRVDIRTRLAEITDYTASSLLINKAQILEGIKNEIELDPADVMEWKSDGSLTLKNIYDIPKHIRQTIQSVKQLKDGKLGVKFCDRQKARDQLMRHQGMLSDGPEININLDLGRAMEEMHQRVVKSQRHKLVDAEFTVED